MYRSFAKALAEELGRRFKVDRAINLDVPTETIVGRISNRWLHPASGRVYAYDYNPPKVSHTRLVFHISESE